MRSVRCLAAGALLVVVGAAGCGDQYRPVVNPVPPTGPASQPTAYAVVLSQPRLGAPASAATQCPSTLPSSPGLITIVDFSGDTILAQAKVGFQPLAFSLDNSGSSAYVMNCDQTLNTVPISTSLQSKNVSSSTLFADSAPSNFLPVTGTNFVVQKGRNSIGALSGSPQALRQEIPVASSVVNLSGITQSTRIYAISQGNAGTSLPWGSCENPAAVTSNGEADAIEVASNTISARLPLGICPVYGVTSPDARRTFILNRGSGTVTVIDAQRNVIDDSTTSKYLNKGGAAYPATGTIAVGAGPVFAELYAQSSVLVTANYDSNTVSFIDVSLDVFGNDSPNFGRVLATVPVGNRPSALTVLGDGSRAYVANQGDATVSVVNLSSFAVVKTIPVSGHPRSIASTYNAPIGKVYTTATDSSVLTVIRTDADFVSATIQLQGSGVDVRTTARIAGVTNSNPVIESHSAGSGAP